MLTTCIIIIHIVEKVNMVLKNRTSEENYIERICKMAGTSPCCGDYPVSVAADPLRHGNGSHENKI